MGCCGQDDDDDLSHHLLPHPPLTSASASASASANLTPPSDDSSFSAVLSPMNSHFSALTSADLLRSILERLGPPDLARASCVCRLWRAVASDREVLEHTFRVPWHVRRVIGEPSSPAFWRHPDLGRFAISHRLRRGDTVPGLALKYSVQVMDIKRLNNMMSDHGIYSRERLLIPIGKPEVLVNSTCHIELDVHAKREVAVLYLEGGPDVKAYQINTTITERGKRKILDSMKRSMHVDDGTAEYYLSVSNGDPRAAILQFSEDLTWERNNSVGY